LELAKEMGIKVLKVIGDSELIVQQVNNQCAVKNEKMKKKQMQYGIQ
jgi:ribonuclease HI